MLQEAAEETNWRTWEASREARGPKAPEKLRKKNSRLASALANEGDKAAEEMHRRVLEIYENVLGKLHPDTLTSIDNLALVLQDQSAKQQRRSTVMGWR